MSAAAPVSEEEKNSEAEVPESESEKVTEQPESVQEPVQPEPEDSRVASAAGETAGNENQTASAAGKIQARTLPGFDLVGRRHLCAETRQRIGKYVYRVNRIRKRQRYAESGAACKHRYLSQMLPYTLSLAVAVLGGGVLVRLRLENRRNVCRDGYRKELEKFREDCKIK